MKTSGVVDRVCDRLFWLGLLGAMGFVLWLPLVPTGDGPVHLYYADVLWSLIRRQPLYAQDYAVRHLFAPYLVHYLALISFEQFASPAMAEKLFVCVIFAALASGFHFLARTLGEHAGLACVWMLPLLFSWSLGGGFLNCCFATGVMLWAFGVWVRLGRAGVRGRVGLLLSYGVLLAVLVLSHPVPLLVLLLFTFADLVLAGALLRPRAGDGWRPLRGQGFAFVLSCCAFVAPVMLAQKGQAAAVLPEVGFHADVLAELASGTRLGYFAGLSLHTAQGWMEIVARVLLVGTVPGVVLLMVRGRRAATGGAAGGGVLTRWLPGTAAERLVAISIIFLACTLFLPRSLNHSYFFPQRMWDMVWLVVLACGAATLVSRQAQYWLMGAGVAGLLLTATAGLPAMARIAEAQQQLAEARLPAGGRGLLVEPASSVKGWGAATTYPVWFWAGARAFAASHAVLLNSPWLGLTILPVKNAAEGGRAQALLDRGLPSALSESPVTVNDVLASRDAAREVILSRADFLLYVDAAVVGGALTGEDTQQRALALVRDSAPAWQCDAHGFYAVCTHAR